MKNKKARKKKHSPLPTRGLCVWFNRARGWKRWSKDLGAKVEGKYQKECEGRVNAGEDSEECDISLAVSSAIDLDQQRHRYRPLSSPSCISLAKRWYDTQAKLRRRRIQQIPFPNNIHRLSGPLVLRPTIFHPLQILARENSIRYNEYIHAIFTLRNSLIPQLFKYPNDSYSMGTDDNGQQGEKK